MDFVNISFGWIRHGTMRFLELHPDPIFAFYWDEPKRTQSKRTSGTMENSFEAECLSLQKLYDVINGRLTHELHPMADPIDSATDNVGIEEETRELGNH